MTFEIKPGRRYRTRLGWVVKTRYFRDDCSMWACEWDREVGTFLFYANDFVEELPDLVTDPDGYEVTRPDLPKPRPSEEGPLKKLSREAYDAACAKGWWADRDLTDPTTRIAVLSLIAGEVFEAIEEERAGRPFIWYGEGGKPEGTPIELADVLQRVFDFAGACGYDLDKALRIKKEFNLTRQNKHGKLV